MAQSPADEQSSGLSEQDQSEVIRAQLAIEMHPDSNCAVVGQGADVAALSQKLKLPRSCLEDIENVTDCSPDTCGECHAEVTFTDENARNATYLKSEIHEKCICPVFEEHDCIPDIRGVKNGAIVAVVTVHDRTTLREILQDLKDIEASVSVEWLVRGGEGDTTVEIDVGEITTKQQEALEAALEAGYYETPRQTNLTELATELSISESAVSQRLNAVETKLVTSFIDTE